MGIDPFVIESHVLHRDLTSTPQKVVSGSGISFVLESGKVVIDACSGPSVSILGHRQPEVAAAIVRQLDTISYIYSGSNHTCNVTEELASELLSGSPGGLVKAIFVNSGSEATDAALKLATQYWCELGEMKRTNFIARKQSYHGNTIGALSVSGHESRRAYYRPWMTNNVSFVDPCFGYRAKLDGEDDERYVARLKGQLEDEILRLGPKRVAAFIAETVSGTCLGCLPPAPGYFKAVREVCDKYGILLILDEIMCGMGKTGTMHAWEQEGIAPDIQTIGKALGGGFVPLSGVLLNQRVFDALAQGTGALAHGHTFQAHPTACAAALAVQKIVKRDRLLDNVKAMGKLLGDELRREISHLPHVGDIRGRGLFWAVEFMQDTSKKTTFSRKDRFSNRVVDVAAQFGLNVLGTLGKTGLYDVDFVIIAPPYVVTASEVKTIVKLLHNSICVVVEEFDSRTKTRTVTARHPRRHT